MNSYIVELFVWNAVDSMYEKKDDCIMTLNLTMPGHSTWGDLQILSESYHLYVNVNIVRDNFFIISRERQNIASLHNCAGKMTIDYEMCYKTDKPDKTDKFGIRFDSRSSASEANFFAEYTKLRTAYQSTEHYPSGRIKMEGMRTTSGYNGICIEYHDVDSSPIKYMGDFEDGKYDGEGDFFSPDCNLRLSCKNICAGKPNGTGKLVVGRNHEVKMITMGKHTDISTIDSNYTNIIYSRVEPMYEDMMEFFKFDAMTLSDKITYMFLEFQKFKRDTSKSLQINPRDQSNKGSLFNLFHY